MEPSGLVLYVGNPIVPVLVYTFIAQLSIANVAANILNTIDWLIDRFRLSLSGLWKIVQKCEQYEEPQINLP